MLLKKLLNKALSSKDGRDNQKGKLYKAERVALESLKSPLPTVKDVERYLKRQSRRKTLQKRYGDAVDVSRMMVADGRGTRKALAYGSYKISLPLWARNDWVAIHEWAHCVHNRTIWLARNGLPSQRGSRTVELGGTPAASHGWQYAAIYIDLVHFCMGKEAADALRKSFREHRVRFKPKRTRNISSADKAVLIERMAAARAARRKA